jgi:hypothetical protein
MLKPSWKNSHYLLKMTGLIAHTKPQPDRQPQPVDPALDKACPVL